MLKITKKKEEANLITHSGTFHPDDVFSTMFLSKIVKNPTVTRVNDVNDVRSDAIIYDIGFGIFDHHQPNSKMRNEKIKYSSFGLLWKEYGHKYLSTINCLDPEKVFTAIDNKLVMQIDAIDNGYFPKIEADYNLIDLDKIIDLFNKSWQEEIDNDEQFMIAVNIASTIFERILIKEIDNVKASLIIEEEIPKVNNNILFLEKYIPYKEAIFNSKKTEAKEIKIVILPSNRGGYNIKPMTKSKKSKELVVNFPSSYLGLKDEELVNVSGVKGAKFVHANGFIASADTKKAAYELASKLK